MNEPVKYFHCPTPGMAGTTPVVAKQLDDGSYEVRMGFALFGTTNMNEAQFEACDYNPWHDEFRDNYAIGIGATVDDAISALRQDLDKLYESIWV